jgi:hypothetical protein
MNSTMKMKGAFPKLWHMQLNQDWNELLPSVSQGEMVLPITEGIGILFKTSFIGVQEARVSTAGIRYANQ